MRNFAFHSMTKLDFSRTFSLHVFKLPLISQLFSIYVDCLLIFVFSVGGDECGAKLGQSAPSGNVGHTGRSRKRSLFIFSLKLINNFIQISSNFIDIKEIIDNSFKIILPKFRYRYFSISHVQYLKLQNLRLVMFKIQKSKII